MPNLQIELDHLAQADEHLAVAAKGVQVMEANLKAEQETGENPSIFEETLCAARQSLIEFERHRQVIVATIADIRAGRLPNTGT